MISPYPRQALHGRSVRISPRNERCTCCTSPRPWQVSQVIGRDPSAAPLPWQTVHSTAVSTLSSRVTPNAASASSISSRTRASWPRRVRGRGPRPWARRAGAAEEGVHDVGEREARALAGAGTGAAERVAAEVVHPALLGVGEHLVGRRDLLEPLLGRGVGVDVGVQLTGKPAVGLLDLVGVGVPGDTEDLVGVLAHVWSLLLRCGVVAWIRLGRGWWRRSGRPRGPRPSSPGSPCGWDPRCQATPQPPRRGRSRWRSRRSWPAPGRGPRGRCAR